MSARVAGALAIAAWVSACAAAAPADRTRVPAKIEPERAVQPVSLKNAGFESPWRGGERCAASWGCTMHSDPDSFRFAIDATAPAEGKQAFCIERVRNEPWALVTQALDDPSLRGKRLRFSIAVRVERSEGGGTGPWVVVQGPMGNLFHQEKPLAASDGWQRTTIEFPVGATAQVIEVGATMVGGGRACVDDARLEIVSGP